MKAFPHHYPVEATAMSVGGTVVTSPGLTPLDTAPPCEFGGPGDRWSPETLLVAAVADCFLLTFRAVARASRLAWTGCECRVDGVLDRVDRVTKFTQFVMDIELVIPAGSDEVEAARVVHKAEQACLVTNSMTAEVEANVQVRVENEMVTS